MVLQILLAISSLQVHDTKRMLRYQIKTFYDSHAGLSIFFNRKDLGDLSIYVNAHIKD